MCAFVIKHVQTRVGNVFYDHLQFEPRYVISNNVAFLTNVDSDEPVPPPLILETPDNVRSVA